MRHAKSLWRSPRTDYVMPNVEFPVVLRVGRHVRSPVNNATMPTHWAVVDTAIGDIRGWL